MQLVRYQDLKAQRWQNGGGITRVIASASTDDGIPDWRISIAEVSKPGPFSALAGIDRIITLIDGEFLLLTVDGAEHGLEKYRPFRFSGDAETSAELPTGPGKDLNLMTRRGAFHGFVTVLELSKKRPHPVFEDQWVVLLQGSAQLQDETELQRFDAVQGAATPPELTGRGFIAVISLEASTTD
ncbi:HutD family protein [Psychromicrobium sp. YIM B11713]|uniref:HutD/Ves family protein n=1 Tax=Psychromicrobium sp. YIM B11713 TaxID=3145233 RepID=UPI00374E9643